MMNRLLGATLMASLVLGAAIAGSGDSIKRERNGKSDAAKNALEGKAPPDLQIVAWLNTGGEALNWKSLKGKVVLLDFWAHWCGPCRASVPHIKELDKKFSDQGLVIIGVHSDKDGLKMKSTAEELGMSWPIAHDAESKTMKAFQCDSYPDYCLIDKKGVLRFVDVANAEIDKAIQLLLSENE